MFRVDNDIVELSAPDEQETYTDDPYAAELVEDDLDELDETSQAFVDKLVDKIMMFMDVLVGYPLHEYQQPFARRIIESVVIGDGEVVTALWARQSGKSETVANTISTLMVLLPRLAKFYPDLLGKFTNGLWVGMFAPVESMAETLFNRTVARLTSEHATELLLDPEIDERVEGKTRLIKLKKSGSTLLMMTANPRAKIESKSFHLILIDEAQDCDDFVVRKSIMPMRAYYNGTVVKIGTPTTRKGDFYKEIQHNKRRQLGRAKRPLHFENHWKTVAKYNPNYAKAVKQDLLRMGEDSDEFMMSYCLKWLLDRGMFTTEGRMQQLGDTSMEVVKAWHRTPVVVGIDPARKLDSTVVTVVYVDWDTPDSDGFFHHRVLNWLELHGEDWEKQYFQIIDFLEPYNIIAVGVDAQGLGDVVADRLKRLLAYKNCEVIPVSSNTPDQSKRWKHLMQLMDKRQVSWPAHAQTRRLRSWKRFYQQMIDAEKVYQGQHVLVKAPEEADAHDDYVDSLAIACSLTSDLTMPEVEQSSSPFYR